MGGEAARGFFGSDFVSREMSVSPADFIHRPAKNENLRRRERAPGARTYPNLSESGRLFFLVGPRSSRLAGPPDQSEFAQARNGQRRVAGFERIFARRFVNPVVPQYHVDVCRHFLARRRDRPFILQGNRPPPSFPRVGRRLPPFLPRRPRTRFFASERRKINAAGIKRASRREVHLSRVHIEVHTAYPTAVAPISRLAGRRAVVV